VKKSLLCLLVVSLGVLACDRGSEEPAPKPAPDVEGTYEAEIEGKGLKRFGLPRSLGGRWSITFGDGKYVLEAVDKPFRVTELIVFSDDTMSIDATPAPTGAFNCHDGDVRLTGDGEASGSYSYELTDTEITLEPVEGDEPCVLRPFLLERTWTLADS
jgi:hypothetical protein